MKKVLMIAPTPFFSDRGCHIRILNSFYRLNEQGNEVLIYTYPLGRNIKQLNIKRILSLPGYKKITPGYSHFKILLDGLLLFGCFLEMFRKNYDFVYAHLHEGALVAIFLKIFFKKRVVFDAQGLLVGELVAQGTIKKQGFFANIIKKIEGFIVNRVDQIITSTYNLKKELKTQFHPKAPIKVVEDYPNQALFNPQIKPASVKLPKDKRIVVYLGGLQKYKGIDLLLKAIPLVNTKFHFLIMGYPVKRSKNIARKLKITSRITFTGKIAYEDAASFLKNGDIAISPKTLESGEANAKLFNYLAMDLPVICFDNKNNRRILKNKGIYVPNQTADAIAHTLNDLI